MENTNKAKPFAHLGSLKDGIQVTFENDQSLLEQRQWLKAQGFGINSIREPKQGVRSFRTTSNEIAMRHLESMVGDGMRKPDQKFQVIVKAVRPLGTPAAGLAPAVA